MKIKSLVSLFIILAVLVSVLGCGGGGNNRGASLTVYVLSYDLATQEAVAAFRERHKDVAVELKQFSDTSQYKKSVVNDVLAGNGPDVIIDTFSQFTGKLLANNAFIDLNELISGDRAFKVSEYNENILKLGIIQNKRYFIPLGYSAGAVVASEKSLQNAGRDVIKSLPLIDRLEAGAQDFARKNKGNKYIFDNKYTFSEFIKNSGRTFIDYTSKKALMDGPEFINALEAYRKIYGSVLPQDAIKDGKNPLDAVDGGLCVTATIEDCMKPENVPGTTPSGEKLELFRLPVYDGSAVVARPEKTVGVNARCKDRKAAFELIKILLSEEIQESRAFSVSPVNKKAFAAKMEAARNNPAYKEYIKDINEGINSASLYDSEIEFIFEDNLKYFLNGGSTAAETAKNINNAVNGYLQGTEISQGTGRAEKKKISVYCGNPSSSIGLVMGVLLTKYNNTYRDSEAQKSLIFSEEELAADLMAGKGPDVMVMSAAEMPSMNMLMKNGVFADLNPLISNDREFKLSDYNQTLMDSGIQNGKRFIVPISYGIPLLVTTKSVMAKNGIDIRPDNWSLKTLAETVKKFSRENTGKEKYFFYLINEECFITMMENSGLDLLDYSTKKSRFDSPEFIELLEIYKEFYKAACPQSVLKKYGTNESRLFQRDVCVMYNAGISGPQTNTAFGLFDLWSASATTGYLMNEDIEVFALPDFYGSGSINGKTGNLFGINNKSPNRQEAFNVIKCALSPEIQSKYVNIPVYNPAFEKYVEGYTNKGPVRWWVDGASEFTAGGLPRRNADTFTEIVNRVSGGKLTDRSVKEIIYAELPGFVSGKNSAADTAKIINRKVSLLLNE